MYSTAFIPFLINTKDLESNRSKKWNKYKLISDLITIILIRLL